MNDYVKPHPEAPLMAGCKPGLPVRAYRDAGWLADEERQIFGESWVLVGRARDYPAMEMRRITVAGQSLIVVRDNDGTIAAFHNTCRHRGSELCAEAARPLKSRLITCPYHQWAYDLKGRLVRVPFASESPDFDKAAHGLFHVAAKEWNGFLFVCLSRTPPPFETVPDLGPAALDNWPAERLVTGHRVTREMACNWKIFWENYNECLHCPGIHPELTDLVPIYAKGVMAANELPGWTPEASAIPFLKAGAESWTMTGAACGPAFAGLSAAERAAGYTFVTLYPTAFVVAHVDYVRAVMLRPLGPERTLLTAEWYFLPETLDAPDFDMEAVTGFARIVMEQDARACEMNQRGLASDRFDRATLMPEEFDIYRFHQWLRARMAIPDA